MTTPNERERVNTLCRRIQVEYDPETFCKLCKELNKLLDVDEQNAKATEWNQARIERDLRNFPTCELLYVGYPTMRNSPPY